MNTFRQRGVRYVKVEEFKDGNHVRELKRGHAAAPVLEPRMVKAYTVFKPSYAERQRMKDDDYA